MAATRKGVEIRAAQGRDVETAERTPCHALRIESGVVQIQAVDKEDAAVDVCLQKRKNPGVATPGVPRDIPVGENVGSVSQTPPQVKKSLQM